MIGVSPRSHWVEQIADAGFVGAILCQSPEYVAPHGSTEAVFGTNPIAVACPSAEGPLVIDLATSAQSWYAPCEAYACSTHTIVWDRRM